MEGLVGEFGQGVGSGVGGNGAVFGVTAPVETGHDAGGEGDGCIAQAELGSAAKVTHGGLDGFGEKLPGRFDLVDVAAASNAAGPAGKFFDADRIDGPGDVLGDGLDRDCAQEVERRRFGFTAEVGVRDEQRGEDLGVLVAGELVEGRRSCGFGAAGGNGLLLLRDLNVGRLVVEVFAGERTATLAEVVAVQAWLIGGVEDLDGNLVARRRERGLGEGDNGPPVVGTEPLGGVA